MADTRVDLLNEGGRRLYDTFVRAGLTEDQAWNAAVGRDRSGLDATAVEAIRAAAAKPNAGDAGKASTLLEESFKRLGLSDGAAKAAARGR